LGKDGVAIVTVVATDPAYSEVRVVNSAGTWTRTAPVWPGKDGKEIMVVVAIDPEYSDKTVVNSGGTWTTTVPI
jgi:hypothetical protein